MSQVRSAASSIAIHILSPILVILFLTATICIHGSGPSDTASSEEDCGAPPQTVDGPNPWLEERKGPIVISHQGRMHPLDEELTLQNLTQIYDLGVQFFETDLRLRRGRDTQWDLVADHRINRHTPDGPTVQELLALFAFDDSIAWNFELKAPPAALPLAASILTCAMNQTAGDGSVWDRTCVSFGPNSPTHDEIQKALGGMCYCQTFADKWWVAGLVQGLTLGGESAGAANHQCRQVMYQPELWGKPLDRIVGDDKVPVHVWHLLPRVDKDPEEATNELRKLCDDGRVDGFMTDNPRALIGQMREAYVPDAKTDQPDCRASLPVPPCRRLWSNATPDTGEESECREVEGVPAAG